MAAPTANGKMHDFLLTVFHKSSYPMGKIKIAIRWTIWTLLGLYLAVTVLLHVKPVQRLIGSTVADALSETLDTKVEIGRVALGVFNNIIIDDVLIEDRSHKPMIQASRLAAKADIIELIRSGKIRISSAQLFGLNANLYKKNKESEPNFQFLLDALSSKDKDTETPLDLRIHSLIIRNSSVKYDEWDAPVTKGIFNTRHLDLKNISGHFNLDELTDEKIDFGIRNLAFTEGSGLEVRKIALSLIADKNKAEAEDFTIELPHSTLSIPSFTAQYKFADKKISLKSVESSVVIENSSVTPGDLAGFLPALKQIDDKIFIAGALETSGESVAIKSLKLNSNRNFNIDIKGKVYDVFRNVSWDIDAKRLEIRSNAAQKINKILNLRLTKELAGIGDIAYTGKVAGGRNSYAAKGNLKTDLGNVQLDVAMKGNNIYGNVKTQTFRFDNTIRNSGLQEIATELKFNANKQLTAVSAKGKVARLKINGYTYQNIDIDGSYTNDAFQGILALNDPNGKIRIDGKIQNIRAFIEKKSKIGAEASIEAEHLNLHALQLSDALGDRTFSFSTTIKGYGSSVDDIIGTLNLNHFAMVDKNESFRINNLNIKTSNSPASKALSVESDFGNINLSGAYDYSTIAQSIANVLHHYLPALVRQQRSGSSLSGNSFKLNANIRNTDLLKRIIGQKVNFTEATINASVNERAKLIDLDIDAPELTVSGQNIEHLQVSLSTSADALNADIAAERVDDSGRRISLNTHGEAQNGALTTNSYFNIPGNKPISGVINCDASFHRNGNRLTSQIHFNPSEIQIDTITLNVQPSDLTFSQNNLEIRHFEVSNNNQHITVNGQTSGNSKDSLIVQLKDIDVPYILELVNFSSVEFDGLATGTIVLKSFFNDPYATADLVVKDFLFERGELGILYANATYEHSDGKININAVANAGDNSQTNIGGYIDIKNGYLNLPIFANNTNLYFLKKYCRSFMNNIDLQASGWCKVVGSFKNVNIEGDMYASGKVDITPIGAAYRLNNSRVRMVPNEIILDRDTIRDDYGNIGIVTGGIHHQSFKQLTYDINIDAHNLLAYNFPKRKGKESFWGRVFGTGTCAIIGRSEETTLNVEMRPEKDSYITYNAADNSIKENSFIRWQDITPANDSLALTLTDSLSTESKAKKEEAESQQQKNFASDLRINFLINTTPDFTLGVLMDETTGDNIALNGSGGIRATYYNKGAFQLFGNYNVSHGLYNFTIQNIIKKQFVFQPGSSIAFGGDPYNAALHLNGVYALNSVPLSDLGMGRSFNTSNTRVNCLLNIEGTPMAPGVTFGLDLPSLSSDALQMVRSVLNSEQDLNQQVLYLLAVGRFYPQTANNAVPGDASQPGQASLAMQSILSGTLSQQINTVLSNVINNSNWNFGANIATGNEGFDNAEYEGILSGKLLNNRLLFNGEFGYRDNVATNTSSFIGDFDIKYLLFPSGNLALNFYNRTNDRYFTRNSLTTQGIGLIMKKDFTNLWDLFGIRRKKAKKEKENR